MRAGRLGTSGMGVAVAVVLAAGQVGPGHAAVSAGVAPAGASVFTLYHPPDTMAGAHSAVEPSIGADWNTGAVMYQADTHTFRVNFDDAAVPAKATWTDVSAPLTSVATLDPILFTDAVTGRTFVSQLTVACSLQEFSDDDGASWTPSNGCAQNIGEDHQSVGGGPFHAPLPAPPAPAYPHAVYYCNQSIGAVVAGGGEAAFCGLSLTGGLVYNPGKPIYTFNQCGGLHGHVRVGPDGTAVVPNQNCGPAIDPTVPPSEVSGHVFPNQAAVVSTDNGTTWSVSVIPGSVATLRSDPSVAFDAANRMYFGFESGVYANNDVSGEQIGGRAMIATSPDDGATWSAPVDVGAPLGIKNITFPEVIAGDDGRAAYAFLGSTTAGDPEKQTFQGLWYLYLARTSDAGRTWTVQNLTPGHPVERGCTFLAGTGDCPNPAKRNLYDFMDVTVDNHGRVLVGYATGCTGACDTRQTAPCADPACDKGDTASIDKLASIARETCGPSLLAKDDGAYPCATGATVAPSTVVGGTRPAAVTLPNTAAPAGTAAAVVLMPMGMVIIATVAGRRRRTATQAAPRDSSPAL